MSLPSIEPLPDENTGLPASQRRRRRRMIIPSGATERGKFLHDLSLSTAPSFDFFLFSLLAGLVLAAALLLDSPALFFLVALIAPFMAPIIGVCLGTIAGALPFVFQSLGSLGIGSLIIFLCGLISGWATRLLPARGYEQALLHAQFAWPDFLVLALGAGVAAFLVIRVPNQKPLVASVAIAYQLYLPVGVAGFGLSSGVAGLWPNGLFIFLNHLVWVFLFGTLVMIAQGLRPLKLSGYLLSVLYLAAGLTAIVFASLSTPALPASLLPSATGQPNNQFVVLEPSPTRSLTPTPVPSSTRTLPLPTVTPTRTLLPSLTPTLTLSPEPTPVWARINASEGGGALVRKEANYNAPVLQSVLNGTLVEVLPEVRNEGEVVWVHIRLVDGRDGWVVRGLLRTATPAPGW